RIVEVGDPTFKDVGDDFGGEDQIVEGVVTEGDGDSSEENRPEDGRATAVALRFLKFACVHEAFGGSPVSFLTDEPGSSCARASRGVVDGDPGLDVLVVDDPLLVHVVRERSPDS